MNKVDERIKAIDALLKEGLTPAQIGAMSDSRKKELEKRKLDEETKRVKKEQAKQQIIAGVGNYLKVTGAKRTEIDWNKLFNWIEMEGSVTKEEASEIEKWANDFLGLLW